MYQNGVEEVFKKKSQINNFQQMFAMKLVRLRLRILREKKQKGFRKNQKDEPWLKVGKSIFIKYFFNDILYRFILLELL